LSRTFRSLILASCFASLSAVALAAGRPPGGPTGFDRPPTNEEIRGRLQEICTGLVQQQDKVSSDLATRRCGCYAGGVVKAMTAGELDEMRATGKFSPSAEPKAKRFMASCKVKS
jgi:hypothetical protein